MRAAIALVALLAACGTKDKPALDGGSADGAMASGDGATSSSDGMILGDGATTPLDAGMSSGCGIMPANPTSYTANTTDGEGRTREYDVFVPSPYDANKPLAVTFVWHGGDESKYSAEGYGVQTGTGAADASIFVFPVGILYQPTGELGWDVSCGGYDMPFFDHMLAEIEAQYCVDPRRVFSAGFSFGCDLSTALMCCRADRVRAIGAASCSNYYGTAADYTTFVDYSYCPAPLTTGVRFTHDASGSDAAYASPYFDTTSKLYQHWLGCSPQAGPLPADTCTTYSGCDDPFLECPYTGLGHDRPPSWGPDTWAFFASFN